jgi:hypothetical protein
MTLDPYGPIIMFAKLWLTLGAVITGLTFNVEIEGMPAIPKAIVMTIVTIISIVISPLVIIAIAKN